MSGPKWYVWVILAAVVLVGWRLISDSGKQPPPAQRPAIPEATETEARLREWEGLETDRRIMLSAPLVEAALDTLAGRYSSLGGRAVTRDLSGRCALRAEGLQVIKRIQGEMHSGIASAREGLERQLAEVNRKYEALLAKASKAPEAPPKPVPFTAEGYLDGVGRMIGCPADFRLRDRKGGAHLCFLRGDGSASPDLGQYRTDFVGIRGESAEIPGWGAVITVKEVRILEDRTER